MKKKYSPYHDRLSRVVRYIEAHLDEPPSLNELARIACFSSYHFHRIFTAIIGESVAAYLRRLLLQRAASELSYSRETVTAIALRAGYDSIDAFTRAFRSAFGLSPSAYRRVGGSSALAMQRSEGIPIFYHLLLEVPPVKMEIKTFPPRLVAATRYVGPYTDCGTAWNTLCGAMSSLGLLAANSIAGSVCHDDPDITPPEKCRMEVCIFLAEGVTAETPAVKELLGNTLFYVRTLGGQGEYASVQVKGPYSLLHPTYRSLYGEWLPQSGREPAGEPGIEIYHNCPDSVPESEILTEILVPLLPKR